MKKDRSNLLLYEQNMYKSFLILALPVFGADMLVSLINDGIKNVVITQPFGCLPNHICGKGMMKPLKEKFPDVNLVAVDYDPGATKINQENRIKLMLSNAVVQNETTAQEPATV